MFFIKIPIIMKDRWHFIAAPKKREKGAPRREASQIFRNAIGNVFAVKIAI
jgi:hypothetical protein